MNYLKDEMRYLKERERRTLIRDMNKESKSTAANKDTKLPKCNADTSESGSESDNESLEQNIRTLEEREGIATDDEVD